MSLIVQIKVIPASGQQKIILDKSGQLKCYLKSQAKRNMANSELIKFLAKLIEIKQTDIEIIAGLTNQKKKIKIDKNISYEQFLNILGIDQQLILKI